MALIKGSTPARVACGTLLAIALSGHALAIATRKAYVLFDTRSGKATELFAYSHAPVLAPTPRKLNRRAASPASA